jgi:AcrR family transcriptional regulator
MATLSTTPESTSDQATRAGIRDAAIEQFGEHGFDAELPAIAEAAGVDAELLIHEFGCTEGLRKACDDYILQSDRHGEIGGIAIDVAGNLVRSAGTNRVVRADDELPRAQHAVWR